MNEIFKIIVEIILAAGGMSGMMSFVLFFKQDKRIKDAEAKVQESTAQNSIVSDYEKLLDRYEKTLQENDNRIDATNKFHAERYKFFEDKLELNSQKIRELQKMESFVCVVEGCKLRRLKK